MQEEIYKVITNQSKCKPFARILMSYVCMKVRNIKYEHVR